MPGPHDHREMLKAMKKEVQEVPKLPAKRVEVVEEGPDLEDMGMGFGDADEFDLEEHLDRLTAQVQAEEEPEQVPVSMEQDLRNKILEMLWNRSDKPSEQQIEAWKTKHGAEAIQVLSLDPANVYIYTHLTNTQWERVQTLTEALKKKPGADVEKAMREAVVKTAVLWPSLKPDFFGTCRAGLPSTLFELILIHSYFLTPQQSMTLTTKL